MPHSNLFESFINIARESYGLSHESAIVIRRLGIIPLVNVGVHRRLDVSPLLAYLLTLKLDSYALVRRRFGENKVCKLLGHVNLALFANIHGKSECFFELLFEFTLCLIFLSSYGVTVICQPFPGFSVRHPICDDCVNIVVW